jgi:ASC-1-like (ASCH) protein
MANYHLAILKKSYLNAVITSRKTIESRFTKTRRPPFGQINTGDKIFFKQSSGPVCATAIVSKVKEFSDLTTQRISHLREKYNSRILGANQYWQSKADCRYAVLIWLMDVQPIEPILIDKKDWRAWIILTEKHNFGLLKDRPTQARICR